MRPDEVPALFVCPACRGRLDVGTTEAACEGCAQRFARRADGRWDFRIPPDIRLRYERCYSAEPYARSGDVPLRLERPCVPPRNAWNGPVPVHLTASQISYLPQARPGELAVDLGCGNGLQRDVLERLGYRCYAIDYDGPAADDLVDVHALPLRDDCIDLVVSIAVLEHLADPGRAVSEVFRTLKPGARFVGTAAFLEPFHDSSFFHFSPLGLWWTLASGGFDVEVVSPIPSWNVLRAQIEMEVGPKMPRPLAALLAAPFAWALEAYAAIGRRVARARGRHARRDVLARHAGAFFFAARKPAGAAGEDPGRGATG